MQTEATIEQLEELAHRAADGIEISLVWRRASDSLTVDVHDLRSGLSFSLDADPPEALDVFYHPFAYAAFRGVEYRRPPLAEDEVAEAISREWLAAG
jgi:hypothetical protein